MADRGSLPKQPELPTKAKVIGFCAATLIRAVCLTLRWEVRDNANVMTNPPEGQMIWTFWHNRIFVLPVMYRKYIPQRYGAVLTSPSNDGSIIAGTTKCFKMDAVRGSSSRGGLRALLSLKKWIDAGYDVAITPDGPRGPCYKLAPGLIMLAQKTGAHIFPIRVESSAYWKLKSWDRFRIPKPFSKVTVIFEPLELIPEDLDEESFEEHRSRIENILNPEGETED